MLESKDNAPNDKPNKFFSILTEEFSSRAVFFKETLDISPLSPFHDNVIVVFIPECRVKRSDEI